ncbi:DnaJ C-terminal domain-containing protein [Pontiellaceae bacterium B12219]|nr:DnaJ C-terminal domain-containing protein [Pontiellaceae bacterium B12219]
MDADFQPLEIGIPDGGWSNMGVQYKDYYEVLGVPRNSTEAAIKKAYRKLAREFHPDVNKEAGAQKRFQEISEAYEVLGDSEKRKRYDQLGANWKQGQDFTPPHGWDNVQFDFGGSGAGQSFNFSGGGFSDFFETLFGGSMGGFSGFQSSEPFGQHSPRRTHDETELTLSLEEAYKGGKKRIKVYADQSGTAKTFDLNIPAGTRDGAKLRLRNLGHNGDLLIRISIAPHAQFTVDGADLWTEIKLAPHQAVLGDKVDLKLVDGRASLRIPPGTQPGRKFRLRGKGLKKTGGEKGDIFAVVKIVIPTTLSSKEKRLYEELAELAKRS